MLGRLVDERQRGRTRPPAAVWGDVLDRLTALDGLFVNLECCLSTRGREWRRTRRAFHFRADPEWAVPALEAAGVDCVALANNHVLDYEEPALIDTLDALDDAGIAHAGAGRNVEEAREPAVVTVAGPDAGDALTVAFVAFTDNAPEYAAGPNDPGTARVEFDVEDEEGLRIVDEALAAARDTDPDLVVASLHWGPNMRESPPFAFREFAGWLVERGVDVVHGHSAHVFQGVEVRQGRPVLYDTGDFVDDYRVDPELRNDRSVLFEVRATAAGPTELRLLPVEIDDCAVSRADRTAAEWSRERMRDLSAAFDTEFDRDGAELVLPLDG